MSKKKKNRQKGASEIPEEFITRLTTIVGKSFVSDIQKTFAERQTTFRINTLKGNKVDVLEKLRSNGFKFKNVPWYKDAFILENKTKRELTDTESYIEGKIYIQSLASMVPPLALLPEPGEKVLDLTAAPGSKTSQMAALMKQTGELIANDNNKIRFFKLKHNMEALGVVESQSAHEQPHLNPPLQREEDVEKPWKFKLRMEEGWQICEEYPNYFDKILLDAPCSAEARFIATDIKTYGYWSEKKVKEMAYKQRKLILAVWQALKPGGVLVYSTCTFSPEENEMQISRLLERYDDAEVEEFQIENLKMIKPLKEWKGKVFDPRVQKTVRILPTKEIEGFFVAKVRKKEVCPA